MQNRIRQFWCVRSAFPAVVSALFVAVPGCIEMTSPTGCMNDAGCDDGLFCNGAERCDDGECVAGSPPCPSDPPCVECEEDRDVCTVPECGSDADCDDERFCNGQERCTDCICESGNAPCVQDEICNEDVDECEAPPLQLTCSIEPNGPRGGSAVGGSTIDLSATVENARGDLTWLWTVSQGILDDPALPAPSLTLGASALGSVTITLVVTDTIISGATTTSVEASCESTIPVADISLVINAGADRILFPVAANFGGSAPFSEGAYLASGQPGGSLPAIIAIVNRGSDPRTTFRWEVVGVPERARIEDVSIANADKMVMTYWIAPNPEAGCQPSREPDRRLRDPTSWFRGRILFVLRFEMGALARSRWTRYPIR